MSVEIHVVRSVPMAWFAVPVASITVVGLATGAVMLVLGRRFLEEFTRPGVTVEQGTPQWGGWTFPDEAEPPRELQRAVTFQSADGVLLRGEFWAQTRSAQTIIISHGFHLPSRHFRSVAALEYAHGANILLFDYRGHGESSLIPTTCGNAEVNDLVAAIDVATSQIETMRGQVYIHGFSMGAAVALLLPPDSAVAGIIADSSYARLDEMICTLIKQILSQETSGWRGMASVVHPFLPALTHLMLLGGQLLFRVRYRHPLIARPDQALRGQTTRQAVSAPEALLPRILLIHAENDPFIALHHAHRLVAEARAAERVIQVYYTPCAIHCGSYGHDPQQYMALLQGFVEL
jgi:pimeloyl-ACP methyl ester carboxylesterase